MKIISHRGIWNKEFQQNTFRALMDSFIKGFGTETDIREFNGKLVVCHDLPNYYSFAFEDLLSNYVELSCDSCIAINIKSDGLQDELLSILKRYNITNYFVFDMSVPDSIHYMRKGINFFTRQSEYEPFPALYNDAIGVWLDEFERHWINEEIILRHINSGKKVCIVSPELHMRPFEEEWKNYKKIDEKLPRDIIMICTDLPDYANNFFNGKD